MGLNKSNGNMYEWVTHTWNPLSGECPHKCSYCSTNKLARYPVIAEKYSGIPRINPKDLCDLGKGKFIFVVAQSDLFANDIPEELILQILEHCDKFPLNRYLFQTKNPKRIRRILPPNSVVCVTLESNIFFPESMGKAPSPFERVCDIKLIRQPLYITIEPIMRFDLAEFVSMIKQCAPIQVNVGANTATDIKVPEPSRDDILALISELEKFTIVKQKSNLNRLL